MPKFVDDLDVAGAMKARAAAGETTQTLTAATGQTQPISAWVDAAGTTVAKVAVDGVVDVAGITVAGAPLASGPVKLNATNDAIIPVDNADSWIVGSDRMDRHVGDTTKDIRGFFNKAKGAFRVGRANNNEWDNANVGGNSFAAGQETKASGLGSTAFGNLTQATGVYSFAEGGSSIASANFTHAEGSGTTASSDYAHAEGQGSTASGPYAHAQNRSTVASGAASHAEGGWTQATADYAHAQGLESLASRRAQHSVAAGMFTAVGDAQAASMVLRALVTTATPKILTTNDSTTATLTGVNTNVLTLTASRAFQLKISTVARRTDVQGEMAGWTWEGLVGRDSTGSARIIGTPVQAAWGDLAADPWDVVVSINTTNATNNYVAVTATGEAGKTIRWVAKMEWVEVAG